MIPDYPARLRAIADALDAQQGGNTTPDWLTPAPETRHALDSRSSRNEQLNYAVPKSLGFKERLHAAAADQGAGTRPRDLVTCILDTALRSLGYPPPRSDASGPQHRLDN